MKRLMLFILLICTAWSVKAQCGAENDAIMPGEELTYELKFNWKFIWVNAGEARMTVTEDEFEGEPCLNTTLLSISNKRVDFFFKMRDTLTCITTPQLEPVYFRKGAEEGSRYTVDEARFTYKDGKCIVDQQRKKHDNSIIEKNDTSDVCVYDMLSILLQARSYDPSDYKPGRKILFSMATGRAVEKQTLIYRGKKEYTSEEGVTYRCLVFSLVEYKKGKEKEVITFYVTDDRNHLPVRLDLYLNFGSAKAFLKTIKGNRHPLTSIVEKQ